MFTDLLLTYPFKIEQIPWHSASYRSSIFMISLFCPHFQHCRIHMAPSYCLVYYYEAALKQSVLFKALNNVSWFDQNIVKTFTKHALSVCVPPTCWSCLRRVMCCYCLSVWTFRSCPPRPTSRRHSWSPGLCRSLWGNPSPVAPTPQTQHYY